MAFGDWMAGACWRYARESWDLYITLAILKTPSLTYYIAIHSNLFYSLLLT